MPLQVSAAALGLALAFWVAPAAAGQPIRVGRPLEEALIGLQRRGIVLVFSTEVVRPGMRVVAEPRASDPRRILDELLEPHGLEVRPAARGVLVVARRRPVVPTVPEVHDRDGSIRGLVVEAQSAAPLEGVLVRLPGARLEVRSDRDGHFELPRVPAGTHRLYVALVGYALAEPDVTVVPGRPLDLTVALSEGAATYTEEIEVVGDPFRGAVAEVPAAMALSSADVRDLKGVLADDPFRAVQALPAVMTGNDLRSEFSVRGGDPLHVGLSIDGISTGWPLHSVRRDWSGGSVGLINADVVDGMALLAGAYPAERPGHSGGWLDVTLREGSRIRTQAHASLSMTAASLVVEGPIGSAARASWIVSARQSYVQWILKRTNADGTTFAFGDLFGKGVVDVTPRQQLQFVAVAGRSLLELDRQDPDPNLVTRGSTSSGLFAGTWRSVLGSSAVITQRVAVLSEDFTNDGPTTRDLAVGSGKDALYRADVVLPVGRSWSLRGGGEVRREKAEGSATRFIGFVDGPRVERVERIGGTRNVLSAYARATVSLTERFSVDFGGLVARAPQATFAPRVALSGSYGAWTARAAAGLFRQPPRVDQSASSFGSGDLEAGRSRHLDASLERRLGGDARIQVAIYQRDERGGLRLRDDEYRIEDGAIVMPSLEPRWENRLRTRASGVELLVQRRSARGLSGWVSYAWARTRSQDEIAGERFDGDYDQRHSFNAFAQYRTSTVTAFSGKLRYGSNFPVIGYLSGTVDDAWLDSDRNGLRLPTYLRLDLRADRAFNMDSRRLTLFVEIVNVFGRTNRAASCACASWPDSPRVYSSGRVTATTQEMFPFLPTAGIVFDF